ncbi:hypothetical protein [Ottowia thiooxydans]|uniref:hypothetical protein n=1 Tax=Ottowia thiooxydans TaxID=219182 RepID=UPI00040E2563|nr:hypothetical protein [Ottowia thiooxydans]
MSRFARVLLGGAMAAVLSLTACGGDDDVDRGPTTISINAKLNGLYWDSTESKLYLTDDGTNTLKVWDGDKTFSTFATLPTAPTSGATLGQLTRGTDGTLYTTRFGFGTDGTVVAVPKSGAPFNVSGLDALRRRIGITTAPDGALVDGWFIRGGTGSVSQLAVSAGQGTEKELVTGLGKPVGLAVVGDRLIVSDQNTARIGVYSLSAARAKAVTAESGQTLATFTTLDGLDLMAAGPDGTVYVGGSGGKLYQIGANGAMKVLATGWPGIRGIAVDSKNSRLFAAVVGAQTGDPSSIRIVPLD